MNRPDFDKLSDREIEQLDQYAHNSLHRVLARIARAEREIENETETENEFLQEQI